MKWYSVEKYKPVTGMDVIVITRNGVVLIGTYSPYDRWLNVDDTSQSLDVTHFCIPDPIPLGDAE